MGSTGVKVRYATGSISEAAHRPRFLPLFRWFAELVCVVDAVAIVTTSIIAGFAYHRLVLGMSGDANVFLGIGGFVAVYYAIVMAARGNYESHALTSFGAQAREIVLVWASGFFIFMIAMFSLKSSGDLSRGATLTFLAVGLGVLLLWRWAVSRGLTAAIARGDFVQRRIIVVGETEEFVSANAIHELRRSGYLPAKVFTASKADLDAEGFAPALRKLVGDIIESTRRDAVEEIVFAMGWHRSLRIEELVHELRVVPLPVRLLPDHNALRFLGNGQAQARATWAVELQRAPLSVPEQAFKRLVDLILAGAATLLLAPLLLMVAALIKLDSRGPVLFTQTRNGFNGRTFRIFKFRSMNVAEDGAVIRQATRHDTRVTGVGRWMRKTSIDELPQLFNVLLGDMSLVGPRPHAAAHNSEFGKLIASYAFRHHVKPGITGWAQVNGFRGETPTVDLMQRRVDSDLWYINNWSLWLDAKILVKTLFIFSRQSSAY